jgi:hypothetical protein
MAKPHNLNSDYKGNKIDPKQVSRLKMAKREEPASPKKKKRGPVKEQ